MRLLSGKLGYEQGFTLIEVIVAIVIITTLVAAFSPLIISSVRNIKWAGVRMQNLYALRGQMERAVASLEGRPSTIRVRGLSEANELKKWEVNGVLISVSEGESSEGPKLVSFVIRQE